MSFERVFARLEHYCKALVAAVPNLGADHALIEFCDREGDPQVLVQMVADDHALEAMLEAVAELGHYDMLAVFIYRRWGEQRGAIIGLATERFEQWQGSTLSPDGTWHDFALEAALWGTERLVGSYYDTGAPLGDLDELARRYVAEVEARGGTARTVKQYRGLSARVRAEHPIEYALLVRARCGTAVEPRPYALWN